MSFFYGTGFKGLDLVSGGVAAMRCVVGEGVMLLLKLLLPMMYL